MDVQLRSDNLTWQELDGSVVVLDLASGLYLELNGSGSLLFGLLRDGTSEDAMAQALCDEFDISETLARQDVGRFLDELKGRGLLL